MAVAVAAGALSKADTPDPALTTLDEKIQRKLAKRNVRPSRRQQADDESEESDDIPGVHIAYSVYTDACSQLLS